MKKLFLLFVCSIIVNCHNIVTAQNLSIEETKTILCSRTWILKTLEQDNKEIVVPEKLQELKMVFNTNGYAYRFLHSMLESDKSRQIVKWSITKKTLTLEDTVSGKRSVNIYNLTEVADMEFQITLNEAEQATFVFEQVIPKNTDDDQWYEFLPEIDSSMKKIAVRMDLERSYYKKIIVGGWDLEKVSFKEIVTKPGDSNDAYTALFKKALSDTKKEVKPLTEAEKDQLDLEASMLSLFYFGSGVDFKEDNKLSFRMLLGSVLAKYTMSYGSVNAKGDNGIELDNEIVKLTSKELVLKDKKLKVTYYYKRSE